MNALKNIRNNLKKGALFRKYFTVTSLIVIACVMLLDLVMMVFVSVQWWNEKIDTLTLNSRNLAARIEKSYDGKLYEDEGYKKLIIYNLKVVSESTRSDYFVVNKNGDVVICMHMSDNKNSDVCDEHKKLKITDKYMNTALSSGFSNYTTDDVFGLGKFVVAVPITNTLGEKTGAVFAVEDAITGILPYMLSILKTFLIAAAVAVVLCFVIVYFSCNSITAPINEMQEITKHFAKGEFDHKANENYKNDYLRDFARSLNKMAYELAIEEEQQKSFVSNVSHELKTPMTTIGGFIDGILDGTVPPEKEREYLQIVSNEVKRLSRMVVSMLNLSKIEAGEISISPKRYEVLNQIFDILLSFENSIEEKHINIEGFEQMHNVYINADKDLVSQVIYNLVDNAVKFTPENGTISFFAENDEEYTTVRVRNTGKGISQEEISRIFERFYKVDKSRSYDTKGVGLGLYIVKTIINMHGGEISASSVEGKYTEFMFKIPIDRPQEI